MHFEFKSLIARAWTSLTAEQLQEFGEPGELQSLQTQAPDFEVANCPPRVNATIGANIAFVLAKKINHLPTTSRHVDADRLSQVILSQAAHNGGDKWFSLSQGEKGYVNGTPTAAFRETFVSRLYEQDDVASVFSLESFIVEPSASTPTSTLRVDVADLIRRATAENEEVGRFLPGNKVDFNWGLMLLGVLDDSELELLPFVNNLSSRQNIPWYFKHFLMIAEQFDGVSLRAITQDDPFVSIATGYVERATDVLVRFRTALDEAQCRGRPERVIGELLELVKTFFAFYNHPATRARITVSSIALNRAAAPERTIDPAIHLTCILRKVVGRGLQTIEICCEDGTFRTIF